MPHKDQATLRVYRRNYYLKNREAKLAYQKKYRDDHAGQCRETNRRWDTGENRERRKVKERKRYYTMRDSILFHKYGLREVDVNAMVARQGGGCAICSSTYLLGVDHNHMTGEVRGVLCRKCNSGIGQFGDDPERVQKAVDYLNGKLRRFFLPDTGEEPTL